jgi:hypothetical protein
MRRERMKILILMMILTGCGLIPLQRNDNEKTHIDKVYECVLKFTGKLGVKAIDAEKVCQSIYRR